MANFGAQILTSRVKLEPLDGPNDTYHPNREKVGDIYRLAPDHLAFVCSHCDEEFPLLIQFTAHIQSHLIQIFDYLQPKESPSEDCDDIFDDGGVCPETEANEDHHMEALDRKPIVIEADRTGPVHYVDNEQNSAVVIAKKLPIDAQAPQSVHSRTGKPCIASTRKFECYLCRSPYKTRESCKRHVREAHTGGKLHCVYCRRNINRNVAHHKKVCGPMNSFKCEHCPFSSGAEGPLRFHLRKFHSQYIKPRRINYKCKFCDKVSHDRASWEQHVKSSHTNELFKCSRCESEFVVRSEMINHAVACAGATCTCRICGQTFDDQAAKIEHMNSHTKRFQCDECGRQFPALTKLTVHKYSHSDVARFKCDECPKAYKHKTGLDTHKLSHRGIRAHKCELCTKAFLVKVELNRHLWRVHRITDDEEKLSEKFICSICNRQYTSGSNLKYHMRRHTGERLLQCSQCDFKCPIQYELDKHMLSHSDRRDFQCDLCPRAFKQKDALRAHTRIHLGEFKFTCKWCNKGFYDKRIYEKHTLSLHGRRSDDAAIGAESPPKGHDQSSSSAKSNG